MATNATVMPIQTHGDAAKYRQPSVHQLVPLPAALGATARAAAAEGPKPALDTESGGGGSGSATSIRSKVPALYVSTTSAEARQAG